MEEQINKGLIYHKLKQHFLKDQITAEYQEQFSDYLCSKRNDGSNIDNWTYEELIAVVEEFKYITNTKNHISVTILKEFEETDGWFSKNIYYNIETIEKGNYLIEDANIGVDYMYDWQIEPEYQKTSIYIQPKNRRTRKYTKRY